MFLEFTRDMPGSAHKVGDVAEFPDKVGRSIVDDGFGKEVSISEHLQRRQDAKFADLTAELTRTLKDAVKTVAQPPAHRIEAGESEADRDTRGRSSKALTPGDLTRAMYWAKAVDDEKVTDGMRRYGQSRLKMWEEAKSAAQTEWVDGVERAISADNPNGITRDGTESGSGGAPVYGYLVRPEFVGDVFRLEAETDLFVNTRKLPIGSGVELSYPALDQYSTSTPTRTSNLFGGVTLYRKPEDAARTAIDSSLSEIKFRVNDLTGMTKVSRDLLRDAFIDLNAYLGGLFQEAFRWRRNWDFLRGTGVGEPLGLLNSGAVINGGGVSGNATRGITGTIVQEDIEWMISKIWPPCRQGMYWILNAQAANKLQVVKNAAGSMVYQPNTMVSQAMMPSIYQGGVWDGMLEGFPVKLTEIAPALNTTGDLTLFSPRYYGEVDKQGLEVGLTEHRYWEYDQVGIRWKRRDDAKPLMKSYVTGADGNTYSFAATLVKL